MEVKKCTKCGKDLPATTEYFTANKSSKDGLYPSCKECKKKRYYENRDVLLDRQKRYYEENKEHCLKYRKRRWEEKKESILKSQKEYYERTKPQRLGVKKQYYQNNKDLIAVRGIEYRKLNRENILSYNKRRYVEKRDDILEKMRVYAKLNKHKLVERRKKYYKANVGKYIQRNNERRSLLNSLPSTLTADQWEFVKNAFGSRCAYCGRKTNLAQEHFIPLSKGGGYTVDNIIPSCKRCNSSKKDKEFSDWYPRQTYYSKERERFILEHLEQQAVDNIIEASKE